VICEIKDKEIFCLFVAHKIPVVNPKKIGRCMYNRMWPAIQHLKVIGACGRWFSVTYIR